MKMLAEWFWTDRWMGGVAGRPNGWRDNLKEAARLREEALRVDPSRAEACWVEFGNHEALMGFYFDMAVL